MKILLIVIKVSSNKLNHITINIKVQYKIYSYIK